MIRAAITGVIITIFFLLHKLNESRGLLKWNDILLFTFIALIVNLLVFFLGIILLKKQGKAVLFTAYFTGICLFFGELQDTFSQFPILGSFTGMRYFLPFCMVSIALVFVWLFLKKNSFKRESDFLFTLVILLSLYELILFIALPSGEKQMHNVKLQVQEDMPLKNCDTCKRPDIYFFLLDEYTGSAGLRKQFNYDNSWFEAMLSERDFNQVSDARSPYILTIYSMASILNMGIKTDTTRQKINNNLDYQKALRLINNNIVCRYLANNGYTIRNISPFDLPQAPSSFAGTFNPIGISLLYYKTIYGRIKRDLPFFLRKKGVKSWDQQFNERVIANNQAAIKEALNPGIVSKPIFTYAHLFMPHAPNGFDSSGNRIAPSLDRKANSDCADYLEYLVYTNKQVIRFIDELKQTSNSRAVIILASDHGYRLACDSGKMDAKNSVLLSYYLPKGYLFPPVEPGISNIQTFRILFNTLFKTGLPVQ